MITALATKREELKAQERRAQAVETANAVGELLGGGKD